MTWQQWRKQVERRLERLDPDTIAQAVGEVVSEAKAELRGELLAECNSIRRGVDLPILKPRIRVAAPMGKSW